MLAEIHRILGDLSAKIGTVLSDMAYIKEDVSEHKREIRTLNGLPGELAALKDEFRTFKADAEARIRAMERDKMPKATLTLVISLIVGTVALLTYLGVTVK